MMAYKLVEEKPEMINILITSSVNSFGTERRFPKTIPVTELKGKLELLTGALVSSMTLQLRDKNDKLITQLTNDNTLGSYNIEEGMRIHVVDSLHKVGEFEDTSKVQKFVLSDEEYEKKADSVRAFKMKNKLGQFDGKASQRIREQEEQLAENITVGDRCEVAIKDKPIRRGTVKYVGETDFKPGIWVGIQYDEPFGKNDGSVGGKRYFNCPSNHGGFVKPQDVTVGYLTPEDFGMADEI